MQVHTDQVDVVSKADVGRAACIDHLLKPVQALSRVGTAGHGRKRLLDSLGNRPLRFRLVASIIDNSAVTHEWINPLFIPLEK